MAGSLKELNLLPEERRERFARIRLNYKLLRLCFLILALAIAGLATLRAWQQTTLLQVQLAEVRATGLEANLALFAPLRTDAVVINDRLDVIDSIRALQVDWTDIVVALAAATPPDVQVVALTPALKNGQLTFALVGKTTARPNIIRFKRALETSQLFRETFLESLRATASESGEVIDFSLVGQLGPPVTLTKAAGK